MNLVLDDVDEYLPLVEGETEQRTRSLGLAVLRGTALTVINPADGFEQIAKCVWHIDMHQSGERFS